MTYNIIADIAGRYDELLELIALMPKADIIILVGDLVDRGPKSKEVVEWAMNTPDVITLKGNHEDMIVQSYYDKWDVDHVRNGGLATMASYGINEVKDYPKEHIDWMQKLPVFFFNRKEGLFVSHAPWIGDLGDYGWERPALWNRYPLKKAEDVFQVHGHNTYFQKFDDYGICIDNSGNGILTGIHWPTKELYEVKYKEVK